MLEVVIIISSVFITFSILTIEAILIKISDSLMLIANSLERSEYKNK